MKHEWLVWTFPRCCYGINRCRGRSLSSRGMSPLGFPVWSDSCRKPHICLVCWRKWWGWASLGHQWSWLATSCPTTCIWLPASVKVWRWSSNTTQLEVVPWSRKRVWRPNNGLNNGMDWAHWYLLPQSDWRKQLFLPCQGWQLLIKPNKVRILFCLLPKYWYSTSALLSTIGSSQAWTADC